MASLDFIRDIGEKLESQQVEYVIFTFQKNGKKGEEVLINTFEWLDDTLKPAAIQVMSQKIVDWKETEKEVKIEENPPKKKKGK